MELVNYIPLEALRQIVLTDCPKSHLGKQALQGEIKEYPVDWINRLVFGRENKLSL